MTAAGLRFDGEINTDASKITRFTVDGDKRQALTGWYILHTDGIPAGEFGCWKRGIQSTWCAKSPNEITPAERQAIEARRVAAKAQREADEATRHAEASEMANIIWEAADDCTSHPYLARKGVASFGLRAGLWRREFQDGRSVSIENALLVPIRDGKKIVSLQAIFPSKENALNRDKDFLPGGKKRACYYPIGKPEGDRPTIVVCEGYATGASIHAATGYPVLVAFDAGNLLPVAQRLREKQPQARLVIAADNDRWTVEPIENPGIHFAQIAARETGAYLVIPEFTQLDSRPTDFNDLHAAAGAQAVADAFVAVLSPKPATAVTTTPANDNLPAAVDWFTPFPDVNGKGRPLATIENVLEACRRLGVVVRYNVIRKDMEILVPGAGFSIDNRANASLAWLASACTRFGISTGPLQEFLTYISDLNLYNPVAEWILSKPWDGQHRLQDFFNTITAEGEADDVRVWDQKAAMMRRWMISATAAAFNPEGVSAHGVLVLQGDQYLGKTKWFKGLAPNHLGIIQDGLTLKPDDKDSVKNVVRNWLVELGELDATFRKSDIAQLKSFLTKDRDVLRRPYDRRESEFARRTVFFASVNPRQFLHDPTGNRRYWTISCTAINHDHGLDMQQVWAEVYADQYRRGETWYLTPDEMQMLNDHNRDHEVLDPVRERLTTRYDWQSSTYEWRWMTATDVMMEIGYDKPTRADVTQCGQLLKELSGGQTRKSNGRHLSRVPLLIR
jgi:putative DNA primase/helicase